jgi:hypothetical protein
MITGRFASNSCSSWSLYSARVAKPPPVAMVHSGPDYSTNYPFHVQTSVQPHVAAQVHRALASALKGREASARYHMCAKTERDRSIAEWRR